ncbi:PucR family transcriptional regulator [Amycolatopsis jejuensis]|uniref:PucR family transcriptional regulator n=1 Tax=Amycolatopsis jejuensis TaxID=330084 RepID=UPI00052659BB|nr:helix-turn-helix domain-containing protein [Amycolatopsis jejuensis]
MGSRIEQHWTDALDATDPDLRSWLAPDEVRLRSPGLGEAPVRWAMQVGAELARSLAAETPALGALGDGSTVFPAAMQESVLLSLETIRAGSVVHGLLGDRGRELVNLSAAADIPLPSVLASVHRGHAMVVERLMAECRRLTSTRVLADRLDAVWKFGFLFSDSLGEELTKLYADELERRLDPDDARRVLIEDVLAGRSHGLAEIAQKLRYDLAYRQHVGIVVWTDGGRDLPAGELRRIASGFLARFGFAQQLYLAHEGNDYLRGWGNRRQPFALPPDLEAPPAVRIALGGVAEGIAGFRQTMAEATQARLLSITLPGLRDRPVIPFADVRLLGLLGTDPRSVRKFVEAELGALAVPEHAVLLETLAAYLDSHSPQVVARQLHIARNTVAYRLRRAEELLGRPITERQVELRVALLMQHALHRPLPPADG